MLRIGCFRQVNLFLLDFQGQHPPIYRVQGAIGPVEKRFESLRDKS